MSALEIISVIKDVILIGAAVTAAIVAIKGLKSWHSELKGKADFEVARALMRSVYKLRDELKYCRSPWFLPSEFPKEYDTLNKTSELEAKAYIYIFTNRWKPLTISLREFEAQALEAEALWSSDFKPKTQALSDCVWTLTAATETFIDNKFSQGKVFESDPDFGKKIKNEVVRMKGNKDPLSIKINNAITAIEIKVRPHFKRN